MVDSKEIKRMGWERVYYSLLTSLLRHKGYISDSEFHELENQAQYAANVCFSEMEVRCAVMNEKQRAKCVLMSEPEMSNQGGVENVVAIKRD